MYVVDPEAIYEFLLDKSIPIRVRARLPGRHGRRAGHDRLRPGPARDRDGHAQQGTTRLAHGPCLERSGPPLDETLKRYYCT